MASDPCVVLVTAPDEAVAHKLARHLLERKLAACVNVIPGMVSLFWWQGKIDQQAEVLLVIKTLQEKLNPLIDAVKDEHPYDTPEIIALPLAGGADDYLKWLRDSVA
jgi:periplasmic divalent cation tolerance protein